MGVALPCPGSFVLTNLATAGDGPMQIFALAFAFGVYAFDISSGGECVSPRRAA